MAPSRAETRSSITRPTEARCWAEINLGKLRQNAQSCREWGGTSRGIMAIVKADAYGHGLESVVGALAEDVTWFGVANLREAQRVSEALGELLVPILILSPATPDEIEPIVTGGFAGSVSNLEELAHYAKAALDSNLSALLHVVVDTGMGRMGVLPEDLPELVAAIRESPGCVLQGIETHFPSADEDEAFTRSQIETFSSLMDKLSLPESCQVHLCNSAGLLQFQNVTSFATLTRPGLALYGISPLDDLSEKLMPTLSLKSRITLIRDLPAGSSISYGRTYITPKATTVATLGVGYGDGYPRHLSNASAEVLIQGRRCPVLGRVTMDQTVVDIGHLESKPEVGDTAVLIGTSESESITATELAHKAGTIPWEILTGITDRVERVYFDSDETDA
ncbi:MAG: alanine racemase [Verrucomicrobiota bacterium]